MEIIGAYEAKTHLPALLKRVAEGEHIIISRHGQPVAQLVPVTDQPADPKKAIRELKQFRQSRTLGELNLRDLIEKGRR